MIQLPASGIAEGDPGPKVFPIIAGVLLIICGLGLILKKHTEEPVFLTTEQWFRLLKLAVTFIVYAVALKFIGFVISTPVLLYVTMTLFDGEKQARTLSKVIYCAAVTAILYLLFVVCFKTNIPTGVLGI